MKKIFFSVLLSVIILHLVYKYYVYSSMEKIEVTVAELTFRENNFISADFKTLNNDIIEIQNNNWYGNYFLEENEKVTLLLNVDKHEISVNTLFGFWFTRTNIIFGFFIILIISIILIESSPEKKQKIRTWK